MPMHSGRPSTSSCRALSEGSCLRRESIGRRTSILELAPEDRMRALGVPERLGHLPRQRKHSLGPPQRKQLSMQQAQTPHEHARQPGRAVPVVPVSSPSLVFEASRGNAHIRQETERTYFMASSPSNPRFPLTPRQTRPRSRARTVGPRTPRSPPASFAVTRRTERPLKSDDAKGANADRNHRAKAAAPPPRWRY